MAAAGPTPISGATGSDPVTAAPVNSGTYTLSESGGPSGYTAGAWSCIGGTLTGASLVLTPGVSATCTINNNDQPATLTLVKTVTNDNGGSAVPTAWTLAAAGPTPISGATGSDPVTAAPVNSGTYTLSESGGPSGYTAGAWSCIGGTLTGASLVLTPGVSATCTINNNDQPALLTLRKIVDAAASGSGKVPADWTLTATPVAITGQDPVTGNGDPTSAGGVNLVTVFAGSYTLTESGPGGFTAGTWVCLGGVVTGNVVAVPSGGNVTCEITNTAVAPTLTLVKIVDNGSTGATTAATAWTLTADGPSPINGQTGSAPVTAAPVEVGTYNLSESGPTGYTASDWVCTGGTSTTDSSVTLAEGQNATCTITNTAIAPRLTLVKVVDNGTTGRTSVPADFTLTGVNGASTITGAGNSAAVTDQAAIVGAYALSETGPAGYHASTWACTGGASTTGTSVTLALGNTATCTITNAALERATIVKDFVSSVQTPGSQDWVVTYTLTVANPNAADPVVYDLSDTIGYPAGVTVTGVAVTSDDVPPGTINPAFDGSADPSIATNVTLAGGADDVYTLEVTATVPATLPPVQRLCAQGPGFGFFNQGTVTTYGQTETDDACGAIPPAPLPAIAKTLTGVPVQQADGSWTIVYALTVTNPSPTLATVYSLTDTLQYGPGIVINSSAVTSTLPVSPTWDGLTDIVVFAGPRIIAPDTTDTYTVTVNATVPTTVTTEQRDCVIQTGETGTGFLNTADLTSFARTEHAEACGSPVSPTLDKTFVSAVQHLTAGIWDGTWDVTYTVAVANPSATTDLIYSLTDTPGFPAAVTINGGTVVGSDGTDPITVLNPTVPGSGTFGIVTDRPLPAGGTDTYTIVLNATVPGGLGSRVG